MYLLFVSSFPHGFPLQTVLSISEGCLHCLPVVWQRFEVCLPGMSCVPVGRVAVLVRQHVCSALLYLSQVPSGSFLFHQGGTYHTCSPHIEDCSCSDAVPPEPLKDFVSTVCSQLADEQASRLALRLDKMSAVWRFFMLECKCI